MIFELAQDFHDAVAAIPRRQGYGGELPLEHPKHRMLELLEEAIRRDIHFIARHPTTLFQCMWNGLKVLGDDACDEVSAVLPRWHDGKGLGNGDSQLLGAARRRPVRLPYRSRLAF